MKTNDYLHSDLLSNSNNNKVFQATYESIRRISWMMSEKHCDSLNLNARQREEYMDVFISDIEPIVLDLVNYTIDKFEK